jgi:hypothetical protein
MIICTAWGDEKPQVLLLVVMDNYFRALPVILGVSPECTGRVLSVSPPVVSAD